jgi:hypothetical protein
MPVKRIECDPVFHTVLYEYIEEDIFEKLS